MITMEYDLLAAMQLYIQKSKTFLWPILNIETMPIETYLNFRDLEHQDKKLIIALYHNKNEQYLANKKNIETNKNYDITFTDDEFDIVTFNLCVLKNDYNKIIDGKYSEISKNFKLFLNLKEKNKMVLKCLDPKKYYKEFADILNINEEELENKELLSPPSYEKETIQVNESIKKQIIKKYKL